MLGEKTDDIVTGVRTVEHVYLGIYEQYCLQLDDAEITTQ